MTSRFGPRRPRTVSLVALAGGLIVTAVLTISAAEANANTNKQLLQLQVRQAAAALAASIPSVQTRLGDALQVALATNSPRAFLRFSNSKVGSSGFASLSLWKRSPTGWQLVAEKGVTPLLVADKKADAFLNGLHPSPLLQVTGILSGSPRRFGIAEYPPSDPRYIVYAENVLPTKERVVIPKSSAFHDLNFAIYLGGTSQANLVESSVPVPIRATHAEASAPFGDSVITLVGTPTVQLAGATSAALPWIALGVGLGLSVGGASALEYIQRRREMAERLAADNRRLLEEQRTIAGTLQSALLPELPHIRGINLAARYLPGAEGIDVGGDWYDVVGLPDGRGVFVVGDISGRGLDAARTMASMRFATRAYIAQGDRPETVLEKLNDLLDFNDGNQFATVLIGEFEIGSRRVTLASAGHPPPLVLDGQHAYFVELPVAPPIGVVIPAKASTTTFEMPRGGTLIAFTDGLVERRGEHLDQSLERLRTAARPARSTNAIVDSLLDKLVPNGAEDDVVILGMRWTN